MAKESIRISIKARRAEAAEVKADVLALGVCKDCDSATLKALDLRLDGAISHVRDMGDFKGESLTSAVLYPAGKIAAGRLLLVGLGERKKADLDTLRQAAGLAASKAVDMKAGALALLMHADVAGDEGFDAADVGRAVAEGAYFGGYRYDEFAPEKNRERPNKLAVEAIDGDAGRVKELAGGAGTGAIFGEAQNFARTIMNRPPNLMYPAALAGEAKKLAASMDNLTCTVWDEKRLQSKKMGGILAVGSGSTHPPRLIVLKYTPARASRKIPTVGLVGKAITFDSGGISIKPSAGMQDMKFDKSGGVAVLGAMKAVAALKPKATVYGIIPSAENLPSATSYRPGDIVTTYSGKTVEIQNTDAEGRMILCDALHFAVEQKCERIVDIATLTGACVVALGEGMAGLMSEDEEMVRRLQDAAMATGDRVWRLPIGDEFLDDMKSKIADLKNTGSTRYGGACTAGAFLSAFVGEAAWAHVDMAGPGMREGGKKYGSPGSVGFGVKLLAQFASGYDV